MHLSRPMYEGLPWLYIAAGVVALGVSYLLGDAHTLGMVVGLAGLAAVVGGIVVLLRRRDFRDMRAQYDRSPPGRRPRQD